MSVEIDLSLPHTFKCEVLDELHGGVTRRVFFPGDLVASQDGVLVQVLPADGENWIGTFAFGKIGKAGVTRVLSMPDPDKVCVVSRGAGYVVSTTEPTRWEAVRAVPILDVRVVPPREVVVFANYTEMLAYGKGGLKWRTKRLAWDGFKIVAVGDAKIIGEYWDIRAGEMQRFEVDLESGAAKGGVE